MIDYDPYYTGTDIPVWIQLQNFPLFTFYDQRVDVGLSHNQGLAGDAPWPYRLYCYNSAEGRYELIASVDAWDKSVAEVNENGEPFPDDVDQDGDGVVYYIQAVWLTEKAEAVAALPS